MTIYLIVVTVLAVGFLSVLNKVKQELAQAAKKRQTEYTAIRSLR